MLRMSAVDPADPGRIELENFVADAFRRKHQASVRSFMPTLLAFREPAGGLRGVIGLRPAGQSRLFLEQYLDRPVEVAISAATGRSVGRRQVVEVGNLAGSNCRAAMRMVAALPAYLLAQDCRWIVFTATTAVREILRGFGAPLVELARAERARVVAARDEWGSYYEADPRVFAGYLPASREIPGFQLRDE
jgi:hypothetical protein